MHRAIYTLLFFAYTVNAQELSTAVAARVDRALNNALPHTQFTVGLLVGAHNWNGVDQWTFGAAVEAWAHPGSRSILVGLESAVINEEPSNTYPKIANNAVFKNRADGHPAPALPMNAGSIAYWVTAQPGTRFERGLVFGTSSVAVAVDFSALSADVPLMKFNDGCVLRYAGRGQLKVGCP